MSRPAVAFWALAEPTLDRLFRVGRLVGLDVDTLLGAPSQPPPADPRPEGAEGAPRASEPDVVDELLQVLFLQEGLLSTPHLTLEARRALAAEAVAAFFTLVGEHVLEAAERTDRLWKGSGLPRKRGRGEEARSVLSWEGALAALEPDVHAVLTEQTPLADALFLLEARHLQRKLDKMEEAVKKAYHKQLSGPRPPA